MVGAGAVPSSPGLQGTFGEVAAVPQNLCTGLLESNLVPYQHQMDNLGSSSGIGGKGEGGTRRRLALSGLVQHVYLFARVPLL